ncbi:hypothetical protein CAEBREN_25588 [Caenorhabditis brenneri]|uniref:F-box domain-containing protein n=1 Tax=Caenorhabditis brenneri TaxID=135651 RepID=G0P553_CAEBE|nr:hypothetical protein CAEBREN_25588 [Caenorhabditis brenneri]
MTIKFLRFPYLVINIIFRLMRANDKVVMSFCSSKMKQLIKSIKWDISEIQYLEYYSLTYITLGQPDYAYGGYFIIKAVDSFAKNTKIFQEKILSQQYGLTGYEKNGMTGTVVQILKDSQHVSRMLLHNQIIELFRTPPSVHFELYSSSDMSTVYIHETLKDLHLSGCVAELNYVEEFFSKAADLNCAAVSAPIEKPLSRHSKLTTAKYLYFENAEYLADTFPLHFNGHRAVFEGSRCSYGHRVVVEVMKKWMSNEGFQNLQSLEIYLSGLEVFDVNQVLKQFDSKPWDPLRRPENYGNEYRLIALFSLLAVASAQYLYYPTSYYTPYYYYHPTVAASGMTQNDGTTQYAQQTYNQQTYAQQPQYQQTQQYTQGSQVQRDQSGNIQTTGTVAAAQPLYYYTYPYYYYTYGRK